MTDVRAALQEAWALSRGRPAVEAQFRAFPLDAARGGARALTSNDGHSGLLLPLALDEHFQPSPALRPGLGGVLEAEVAKFAEGALHVNALVVWCRDPALSDVFLSFCEALIERCEQGTPVSKALDLCHSEFQRLLADPQLSDMSALVGLLGELLVLVDLTALCPEAALGWGGAHRERHDFRYGRVAMEVKTSLRSDASSAKVRISAIDQLDPPDGGRLFLHAIRLERSEGGPVRLLPLLRQVEGSLGGAALAHFHAVSGIPEAMRRDTRAFSILSRRAYHVASGFPSLVPGKLVSGHVDPGVSCVQYDLDLSYAEDFSINPDVAVSAFVDEVRPK